MMPGDAPPIELSAGRGRKAGPSIRRPGRPRGIPTFPTPPGRQACAGVLGALAFLEGAASDWTVCTLLRWFNAHLVAPGLLKRPCVVRELGATPVLTGSRAEAGDDVEDLITMSRRRVIVALRGLLAPAVDDRFLHAAIYCGRVRRTSVDGKPSWVASPGEVDCLSDIVLSLLAADILADRDFYSAHLCMCDVCGRVTYREAQAARAVCPKHHAAAPGFTLDARRGPCPSRPR
jgi:hypothetical protein